MLCTLFNNNDLPISKGDEYFPVGSYAKMKEMKFLKTAMNDEIGARDK